MTITITFDPDPAAPLAARTYTGAPIERGDWYINVTGPPSVGSWVSNGTAYTVTINPDLKSGTVDAGENEVRTYSPALTTEQLRALFVQPTEHIRGTFSC